MYVPLSNTFQSKYKSVWPFWREILWSHQRVFPEGDRQLLFTVTVASPGIDHLCCPNLPLQFHRLVINETRNTMFISKIYPANNRARSRTSSVYFCGHCRVCVFIHLCVHMGIGIWMQVCISVCVFVVRKRNKYMSWTNKWFNKCKSFFGCLTNCS